VDIRLADLDDEVEMMELATLLEACRVVDAPFRHPRSVQMLVGELRYGWDLEPDVPYVAYDEEELVAHGSIYVTEWDNRELAWLGVSVHPQRRCGGVGSRVLRHLEGRARKLGRPLLGTDAWDGSPGVAFALSLGYDKKSQAVMRRQDLAQVDLADVRRLYEDAETHAAAYELLRLRGPMPEDMLEEFCRVAASINDAPLDDLEFEDEVYAPQRVRDHERASELRHLDCYRVVARHRRTGELGGHTTVMLNRLAPTTADQEDTAVAPQHRGQRLGLALKADMLLWLAEAEPQLRTVDTWNTESNDHMIRINERLGYRPLGRELQFQKRV
jgi:GNAT superfamily N-acetyltransferase